MRSFVAALLLSAVVVGSTLAANGTVVWINRIDGENVGPSIGIIHATDTPAGLMLMPDLYGLPPGEHGFHLHENPSCAAGVKDGKAEPGLAAGDHWDPEHTGQHLGPLGEGHTGDLPVLIVGDDGRATEPVIAARLTTADLKGHAILIHAGGDNYGDTPLPLGGGGGRIACGVVPAGNTTGGN